MHSLEIGAFEFDVPIGWFDVTDDGDPGDPLTLGKEKGQGALQFSTAKFVGGAKPNPQLGELEEFRDQFCVRWLPGLDATKDSSEAGALKLATAHGFHDEAFMKCWYVSCGQHFALITYTLYPCSELSPDALVEIQESEMIVRSARELTQSGNSGLLGKLKTLLSRARHNNSRRP
jgi:hypothetical protein